MKLKLVLLLIFFSGITPELFSQARPSLNISFGLAFPGKDFGGDLVVTNDSGISNINPEFIRDNYGTSTGASVTGMLRFPIEKRGIINGIFVGSYSYFNVFRKSFLGTTIENSTTVPVAFESRFSVSTFGLGIEASGIQSSKIRPYVNTNFTINILSLILFKNNFSGILFNDAFRMGLLTNAGAEIKLSSEYSVNIGVGYNMSNLFLKSQRENFNDRVSINREGVSINDEEGRFYSNVSDPDSPVVLVEGQNKNVAWWNFNIGLNIMLGKSSRK